MLFGSLKYPFLTYVSQFMSVHLLDKISYMCEGTARPSLKTQPPHKLLGWGPDVRNLVKKQ